MFFLPHLTDQETKSGTRVSKKKVERTTITTSNTMYWMQNLLMKTNGLRRRQSQSPSPTESSRRSQRSLFGGSKHKRRLFRRDGSTTEGESLCSSASSEGAPWRVENIRSAPPKESEWWEDAERAASEGGNAYDDSQSDDDEERKGNADRRVSKSARAKKRFHNCGLETWLRVREEWKRRTVETTPSRPTPVEYSQLVRGLTKSNAQRTYELPRRMALSDVISAYNDIWDGV